MKLVYLFSLLIILLKLTKINNDKIYKLKRRGQESQIYAIFDFSNKQCKNYITSFEAKACGQTL